jgi:hypothetical protein
MSRRRGTAVRSARATPAGQRERSCHRDGGSHWPVAFSSHAQLPPSAPPRMTKIRWNQLESLPLTGCAPPAGSAPLAGAEPLTGRAALTGSAPLTGCASLAAEISGLCMRASVAHAISTAPTVRRGFEHSDTAHGPVLRLAVTPFPEYRGYQWPRWTTSSNGRRSGCWIGASGRPAG